VRPEGCRGSYCPASPQGPMLECPVREPCPPKCCYPDRRRSNPTSEAPGTTASIWEHRSGGGPAEDGRLNASERPYSRSVIQNRPKVLIGRSQNGTRVGSPIWNPRRRWRRDPPDYRAQPPHPPLHIGQQGKPHSPRRREAAVSRPRGRGMAEGVEESRSKRRPSCNGTDRARASGGYPARKGADFRRASTEAKGPDAGTARRR
jgi:hypothetical protein